MDLPDYLLTHTITVEPYRGPSAHAPVYGPPVWVPAFVDEHRRTVRADDGRQVTSSTTAYVRLDPGVDITPEARVTVRGRPAEVIAVRRRDGGGLPTPDHIEIVLQ